MNLLGAVLYDPAVAVSKATSSLLAMTAFDTTNLRLAITVPAHGKVRFRLMCTLTGATTFPVVLLGVMNGANVVGRATPTDFPGTASAASQTAPCMVDFIATGLVAGAANFDAAYAVQVLVAATNFKYGGPNTNAGANAWGAFIFEAWDPQPMTANSTLTVDANGRVDVSKVAGTAQTARDLGLALPAAAPGAAGGLLIDDVWTDARAAKLDNLDAAVTTRLAPTTAGRTLDVTATGEAGIDWANIGAPTTVVNLSGTTTSAVSGAVGSVTGAVGSVTGAVGSVTAAITLPAIPNNWITAAGITAAALNAKGDWLTAAGYTAPDNANIAMLVTRLSAGRATNLDNLDATVSSRFAAASYVAPDNAGIAAVKAKTDSLSFAVAGKLDVNVLVVNGVTILGDGSATPFHV